MKYLLDTNICIYIINESPSQVLERLNEHKSEDIYISAPTISELYYGAYNSKFQEANLKKLDIFIKSFGTNILKFDIKSAKEYGAIRAYIVKNNKRDIGDKDMDIASIAISNNMTLVTNNEKDFEFLPNLPIQNWAR